MSPEEELKLLEMAHGVPQKPSLIPITFARGDDPFLKVPEEVLEYAKAINHPVELESDGRMHYDKYPLFLNELGIQLECAPTLFITISKDDHEEC